MAPWNPSCIWGTNRRAHRIVLFLFSSLFLSLFSASLVFAQAPPAPEPTADECVVDEDCGECEWCNNGACFADVPWVECESNEECENGFECGPCATCIPSEMILPSEQGLCESTGGIWNEFTCGDAFCGVEAGCNSLSPGCNCGDKFNFGPEGCFKDPVCELPECTTDADCDLEYACINEECVSTYEPEPECKYDNDCPDCAVCAGGECQFLGDEGCGEDMPCEDGFKCLETNCGKQCMPIAEDCAQNSDCKSCEVCSYGTCTPLENNTCDNSADCGEGFDCGLGECGLKKCIELASAECTVDSDCGECGNCDEGYCGFKGQTQCQIHADCGDGFECIQGACGTQCVESEIVPDFCNEDEECGPCGICGGGSCFSSENDHCTSDSFCDEHESCVDTLCGKRCAPLAAPQCNADADCGSCQVCADGQCYGTGLDSCGTDWPCENGFECVQVGCANECAPIENPECITDEDCACGVCEESTCSEPEDAGICGPNWGCDEGFVCQQTDCNSQCVPEESPETEDDPAEIPNNPSKETSEEEPDEETNESDSLPSQGASEPSKGGCSSTQDGNATGLFVVLLGLGLFHTRSRKRFLHQTP